MADARRWVTWALAAGVIGLAVLFFFQYRDPMILVFGLIAAGLMWAIARSMKGGPQADVAAGHEIRVRCLGCRALNAEEATFCSSCGRAL